MRQSQGDTAEAQMCQVTLWAQEVRCKKGIMKLLSREYFALGRPAWVEAHLKNRLPIPHTFVIHTYTKPTKCHLCHKVDT